MLRADMRCRSAPQEIVVYMVMMQKDKIKAKVHTTYIMCVIVSCKHQKNTSTMYKSTRASSIFLHVNVHCRLYSIHGLWMYIMHSQIWSLCTVGIGHRGCPSFSIHLSTHRGFLPVVCSLYSMNYERALLYLVSCV